MHSSFVLNNYIIALSLLCYIIIIIIIILSLLCEELNVFFSFLCCIHVQCVLFEMLLFI